METGPGVSAQKDPRRLGICPCPRFRQLYTLSPSFAGVDTLSYFPLNDPLDYPALGRVVRPNSGKSALQSRRRARRAVVSVLALWMLFGAVAAPSSAAQGVPSESEPIQPESEPIQPESEPIHEETAVVFLVQDTTEVSVVAALGEAIRAQLADARTRVVMAATGMESLVLQHLVDLGEDWARQEAAVGVFFLDARRDEQWLLYLVDPKSQRVLVRRAGASLESLHAAIETVAVITEAAATALAAQQAAAAQGISPPPAGDSAAPA